METIEQAMEREGVFQLRRWFDGQVTVEMRDGRKGRGSTFREAIDNATFEIFEVAA